MFYFMLVTALIGGATMIWWHAPLTGAMTAWLVLSGLLGGIGQIAMTYSYRYAEPSLLAPFDYAGIVMAVPGLVALKVVAEHSERGQPWLEFLSPNFGKRFKRRLSKMDRTASAVRTSAAPRA